MPRLDGKWRIAAGAVALGAVYGYARYAVRRFEDLEPESAGAPGAFVDVDGVRLHYVEAGTGEPVLLIHGLNASTFSFRHVIPELARHFRVIAMDLKGFGYSERQRGGDYTLTAHAELARGLLDRLGVARAAVIGHSLGGAVSMRLALRHPDRVSRLVLVDSASDHDLRRGAGIGRFVAPLAPVFATLTLHRRTFRRRALLSAVHDPAFLTPEIVDEFFKTSRMKGHLASLSALMAQRGRDEPVPLERIGQPTLVLWGEHDRWIPLSRGEALADAIPDARLVMVRSAGHLPLEEQPDSSNKALLDFLLPEEAAVDAAAERTSAPLETPS